MALSVISAILSFVYLDDIVDATLEASGAGTAASTEDAARVGGIIGAVVGLAIGVVLYSVLAIFLNKGANWARIVLTILAGLGLLFGLFGLVTGAAVQPAPLIVVSALSLALTAALIFFLWKKESSQWLTRKA